MDHWHRLKFFSPRNNQTTAFLSPRVYLRDIIDGRRGVATEHKESVNLLFLDSFNSFGPFCQFFFVAVAVWPSVPVCLFGCAIFRRINWRTMQLNSVHLLGRWIVGIPS